MFLFRQPKYFFLSFLFAVAAGTIIGGPIGDRIARKYVIWDSIPGVAPFTLALPASELGVTLSSCGEAKTFADAGLFRRAISNLVSNAIKNTPEGGQIKIIVERETGFVQVRVTDTGCGIESKHLPKLFDRFYRTDASRAIHSNGVGLGLAIVKGIMNLKQALNVNRIHSLAAGFNLIATAAPF